MKEFRGTVISGDICKTVPAAEGELLLDVIRRAGVPFSSPCGGNGTCGKCRAFVSGAGSSPDKRERELLSKDALAAGIRLTCMCRVLGDFTVTLDASKMQVQTQFSSVSYTLSPMIRAVRRQGETVFYDGDRLIDISSQDAANLGLAVDVGTTTVALYLCELDKGEILATVGFRNPQSAYGADVISRIDKIMKDKSALEAEKTVLTDAIRETARQMCHRAGVAFSDVRACVLCGNTTMQHIAAGIDPSSIAVAPFTAPTLFGEVYNAASLGLLENPNAIVYFAPCFASYVGGDIACGMIATGLSAGADNVIFIDIGTNGEIGLSTKNGLYFCSAAAGPAFEGAHIACGMAGIPGAISQVSATDKGLTLRTVGDLPPIGICGSGILDAAAVMLDLGLLDETGRICDIDEAPAYTALLDEDENGDTIFVLDREHDIYMTGKDIREIQLAKAAIAAGIETLLHKAGLTVSDVTSVVLAGGFGSHINPSSACRIGLIPRLLEGKVIAAGNTAGAGAVALLLGDEPRETARTICAFSDYTELSCDAYFMEKYIDEMMFDI